MLSGEVVVSIKCLVYNHERFLRQCLDGFVMQKTNFKFEAIVHDDCSTDKSVDIIKEYAQKYPNIIKPIYEDENQYSKGFKIALEKINKAFRGKYIALCEGDDYWTDPYKLQKQVDFLESHPDYTLCFHNAIEHWDKGEKEDSLFVKNVTSDHDYTGIEILKDWTIPTASVVFRRSVIDSDLYQRACLDNRFAYGDIVLFLTSAELGKIHCLNEVMSVYRRHEGGAVFKFNYDFLKKMPNHNRATIETFGEKYKAVLTPRMISYQYFRLCLEANKRKDYRIAISSFVHSFIYSPNGFYLALKEYFCMKLKK